MATQTYTSSGAQIAMGLKQEAWLTPAPSGARFNLSPIQKEISKRLNITVGLNKEYMMIEDDMSFMEDVFLKRQLPFPEYLVQCGYHSMTRELHENAEKNPGAASSLGKMMDKYGAHYSAKYEFPCKGGAVMKVSVISGMMFYSRKDAPYEIMGPIADEGDEDDSDDPLPYQTDEELMIYLAKMIDKAKEY